MRALLQRVRHASVTVDGVTTGKIGEGLLVLLGVRREDTREDLEYLAEKIPNLRIFHDKEGRMNRSVIEVGGSILLVSQFTLYASTRKGRRPGFDRAAPPEDALRHYREMIHLLSESVSVETGEFGARMSVELLNEGPVTIMLDSEDRRKRRDDV